MPSILIHLAIANKHLQKHSGEVKNIEAFHKGSIAPDLNEDFSAILDEAKKEISHYYDKEEHVDFKRFLHDPSVDLTDDFWKGYYLHLLADEIFYMKDFKEENERSLADGMRLYQDYQHLARWLIKKYRIDKKENFFTKRVLFLSQPSSGKTQYIKKRKLKNFINKMSRIKIS